MISYQEALEVLSAHQFELTTERVAIEDANQRVLAEDIKADRSLPPYNRVTMDGIAIHYDAYAEGQRSFEIIETLGAGVPQKSYNAKDQCVQIMTGAMMPKGLDTVIRYEDITIEDGQATINVETVKAKQNIHFKGEDRAGGEVVLEKGMQLSSAELIIAAAVGKSDIEVYRMPTAAIITTGDELVDIKEVPAEHQVRRSSNYGILASLQSWGIHAKQFHFNDDKDLLKSKLSDLIESFDLLVLTGGVSRGKFDFLPEVLDELGVERHFHKVKQRPGKPFWFGTAPHNTTVFALPGNPVSSFVCAQVYLRYWLKSSLQLDTSLPTVRLKTLVEFMPPLTYFLECKVSSNEKGERVAQTFKGNGSGDFANLTQADGFIVLPDNKNQFNAGEVYPYISFR